MPELPLRDGMMIGETRLHPPGPPRAPEDTDTHVERPFRPLLRRRVRPPAAGRPRPPVAALLAPLGLRAGRDARHRARRGCLPLRRQGQALPRRARRPVRQPARARPHRLAEAAAKQAAQLAFMPLWSYAHPKAMELAERVAGYAPGDLNRVFFTSGGGEAVESAWKLAKNYFKLTGKPTKHKVISRAIAYHGTPQGALSITGIPMMKAAFEPLVPSTFRVPNTNFYRAPERFQTGAARRPRGLRPLGRRRDRGRHRERGRRHRRRGVPRAGAELRRLLPASARLLRAGPRDLRRVRRAAGQRRGHLRLRPARPLVRRGALRLPARHHHLRQGHSPRATPRSAR